MRNLIAVIGPTASGKSAKAVELALERNGEIVSVDSRQVYRMLDIGTEKIAPEEMRGVPHHLIDIRDPEEIYSAGDFVEDARRLIDEITSRGRVPILVGGTHFYFDALLHGLPEKAPANPVLRAELETKPAEELFAELQARDVHRAMHLDPSNKRRIIRALELVSHFGKVPGRGPRTPYEAEWIRIDLPEEELRARLHARLEEAISRGLIEEVGRVRERVGDERLNELGLEYRIVGQYLRGERDEPSLLPALKAKLWQYARRQKAWLRKLASEAGGV